MKSANQPASSHQAGPELSDRSLLRRLRLGSQDAATELYVRYAHRLEQLAQARCGSDLSSRLDAEDIVQSVFSSFFRGVNQGYYDVAPGDELWRLLLVIALNKIRARGNYHRAGCRDVRATTHEVDLEERQASVDDSDHSLAFLEMVIDEILQGLPDGHRDVVRWRIEGHEVAEIADRSGAPGARWSGSCRSSGPC